MIAIVIIVIIIIADGTVLANRPDTVLHDAKRADLPLTDIAIPDSSNVNTKETEQLNKYKDLGIEGQQDVDSDAKTVPVIVGALGTIKKGLDQRIQSLLGHRSATELQVTLMGIANSIRKVLG